MIQLSNTTYATLVGERDAQAIEIARLQVQLAASQALVVELAGAHRADAAAEADGIRHDEYCDRANAEGWDNDPTGSSHISSSASRLRTLQEHAATLKRAALSKVGRQQHPAEADASAAVRESHEAAWGSACSVIQTKI